MPAARDMLVGSERAAGALPPTVVTLMMRPPPRRFMWGMTSRQNRIAPMTFESKSYCHVASSTCSKPAADEVPALFTRMSIPPNRATVAATKASTSGPCVTSVAIARMSAPVVFWIASTARSSTSFRRAHTATFAPLLANRSTQARPSPSLPPVTIATLPAIPSSRTSMIASRYEIARTYHPEAGPPSPPRPPPWSRDQDSTTDQDGPIRPDHGKVQRGMLELDAEVEREHVEFDAFLPADREPGEPEERELNAGSARRGVRDRARQEILADRRRWQLEPELGHAAAHPGRER